MTPSLASKASDLSLPPPSLRMPADPYDAIAGVEVAHVLTPLTSQQLLDVIVAGHVECFSEEPSYRRRATAWAMLALEHAGGHAVHGYNLGNIGLGSFTGDHEPLRAREVLGGHDKMITQQIRAHDNATTGAADYWDFLARRFPKALALFDAGDCAGVARELKQGRYYTAPEAEYAHAMVGLYADFERRWPE